MLRAAADGSGGGVAGKTGNFIFHINNIYPYMYNTKYTRWGMERSLVNEASCG